MADDESGVMVDLDRGRGVLVALHGHGDEPGDARAWGRRVAPPGWEVVAPGASRGEDGQRSWFETGPRGADDDDLRRSVAKVADVVEQVTGSGRPVILAGFSQGAAIAAHAVLSGVACDGALLIAGFIAEPASGELPQAVLATSRIFVVGADGDEVVPDILVRAAADLLEASGAAVDLRIIEGGHAVSPAAAGLAREWIARTRRSGPRVSIGLPVDRIGTDLCSAAGIVDLSVGFERMGFDAAFVTDHPAPDERWLTAGGHHALEPTVALAVAATVTTRLLLHTNVYVLAYRNPFLAAKAIVSLDLVAEGRLILGVAAGYLRPEFAALGRSFDERASLLDEALELVPRIWSGDVVAGEGSDWSARSVMALPTPYQRPHPPIWVGGNSVAAMRRAARHGQGWSPLPTPGNLGDAVTTASIRTLDDLRSRLDRFRCECEVAGRTEPLTTCFVPFSQAGFLAEPVAGLAPMIDEIAQLDEMGVDWVALSVPGSSRSEVLEHAAALADELHR